MLQGFSEVWGGAGNYYPCIGKGIRCDFQKAMSEGVIRAGGGPKFGSAQDFEKFPNFSMPLIKPTPTPLGSSASAGATFLTGVKFLTGDFLPCQISDVSIFWRIDNF